MKRLVVLFMLSTFLLSTTEFSHVLKIPLLFTHFNSHKELDKDLTFSGFLALHYLTERASIPHDDQDMKLPFKMHDSCSFQLQILYMPVSAPYLSIKKIYQIRKKHSVYLNDLSITSSYLASIWQPPKFC